MSLFKDEDESQSGISPSESKDPKESTHGDSLGRREPVVSPKSSTLNASSQADKGNSSKRPNPNGTPERPDRPDFLSPTRFTDFDLPQSLIEGLDVAGFFCATPAQAQIIPDALKGKDIACQAMSGTGKTVAYLVPMMARLIAKAPLSPGAPRALVLCAAKVTAEESASDAVTIASTTGLSVNLAIHGKTLVEQTRELDKGPAIVVGTPQRMLELINSSNINLSYIEFMVIDDANRLLEKGLIRELQKIFLKLPAPNKRQSMLFSNLLNEEILDLTYQYMNQPQYVTAGPDTSQKDADKVVSQEIYHITRDEKFPLVLGILAREPHSRMVIFCNTGSAVSWVAKHLAYNGYRVEGIYGDLAYHRRTRVMRMFRDRRTEVLVATDQAIRSIHIDDVSHIINYDLPQEPDNYLNRVGRVDVPGGKAISFACEEYVSHLDGIENILGKKITVVFPTKDMFGIPRGKPIAQKTLRAAKAYQRAQEAKLLRKDPLPSANQSTNQNSNQNATQAINAPHEPQVALPAPLESHEDHSVNNLNKNSQDSQDIGVSVEVGDYSASFDKADKVVKFNADQRSKAKMKAVKGPQPQASHPQASRPNDSAQDASLEAKKFKRTEEFIGTDSLIKGKDSFRESFKELWKDELNSKSSSFSTRPGGVFGLSQRFPVTDSNPDRKIPLDWKPGLLGPDTSESDLLKYENGANLSDSSLQTPKVEGQDSYQDDTSLGKGKRRRKRGRFQGQEEAPAGLSDQDKEHIATWEEEEEARIKAQGDGKYQEPKEAPEKLPPQSPGTLFTVSEPLAPKPLFQDTPELLASPLKPADKAEILMEPFTSPEGEEEQAVGRGGRTIKPKPVKGQEPEELPVKKTRKTRVSKSSADADTSKEKALPKTKVRTLKAKAMEKAQSAALLSDAKEAKKLKPALTKRGVKSKDGADTTTAKLSSTPERGVKKPTRALATKAAKTVAERAKKTATAESAKKATATRATKASVSKTGSAKSAKTARTTKEKAAPKAAPKAAEKAKPTTRAKPGPKPGAKAAAKTAAKTAAKPTTRGRRST
ncbi:MAG: DEAD/DEAH box helicase [Deltaproteobacteria bacterium]|jgi:ATP-dependent RNA helicase RhlB|nr:DEAD/DEAH box helicase [Deltaproteobacteria bacterium]